eukprot:c18623_g1_i1 orf=62-535(+)
MACTDIDFLWKDRFREDPSGYTDIRNSKRGHTQTRELPCRDGWHNPPWPKEELIRSGGNGGDFCVRKSRGEDKVHQEFYDRTALFDLIKHCGKQKNLLNGSRLHAEIHERRLLMKDISLGNALLSMYVKCGTLAKAQETFDELPSRNVVTWNALIAG